MRTGLFALSCMLLSLSSHAQNPPAPTLHTGTQIVVVDVTVTDSQGNAVPHLKSSDFTLLEDAAPQTISHFEEHTPSRQAALSVIPPLGPNTYTNFIPTPEDAPTNVLLIDTLNTPIADQANTRQKLIAFIEGTKAGTRLAIFGLSTRLTLLQGFTSDPKLLLAAVSSNATVQNSPILGDELGSAESLSDTVRIPSPQIKDAMRQTEAVQSTQQDHLRALSTLTAMNQIARYLSGIPGRKNLLWISGSFPLNFLPNRSSFATTESFQTEVRETTNLLSRSQVAIYPIDSKGLQNSSLADASAGRYALGSNRVAGDVDIFSTQTIDRQNTMRRLAESTGGTVALNTNDLRQAVEKAIATGSKYYTLVYSPTDRKADGGYRKITIHLASGSFTLAYRTGYYAEDSMAKPVAETKAAGKQAPSAPVDSMRSAMRRGAPPPSEIVFKALLAFSPSTSDKLAEGNVAVSKSKPPYRLITVAYAANPGDITMPLQPDGLRHVDLHFVVLVYDRDGKLFTQQTNRVNVFAKPQAYEDFMREGVRYQQLIAVPARGEYYLRTGIRDLIGDKMGVIEIPASSIAALPSLPTASTR